MNALRRLSALTVVAIALAATLLPIAKSAERRGCHCLVRMACCEDGTCTMGDEPPASGPEWRTCRRETSAAATSIDIFDRALTDAAEEDDASSTERVMSVVPVAVQPTEHIPATPPPRGLSF